MSRTYLTPVAEQELLQARERFTLPSLVWDVFEGVTSTPVTQAPVTSTPVTQAPSKVTTQAPVTQTSVTSTPAVTQTSNTTTIPTSVTPTSTNDNKYWYEQSLQYYPAYTPPFNDQVDYDGLYSHLFHIFTNLNTLRLQLFVPTTLAKQIEQEQHRMFTLVYPVTLPLHYIATPFEKAFIDPDIVIRRLDKLVLIGVSDRNTYLGPLPDITGKARPLIEKKIDPMDYGAVKELKATVPGKYYTIANNGLISFLKEAKRAGYLQQVTGEFIVDDNNRELVQGMNVDNV